jgi:acyl carrier protein
MNLQQQLIADRLREILVEHLRLPMKPEEIEYNVSLSGDVIRLDSRYP